MWGCKYTRCGIIFNTPARRKAPEQGSREIPIGREVTSRAKQDCGQDSQRGFCGHGRAGLGTPGVRVLASHKWRGGQAHVQGQVATCPQPAHVGVVLFPGGGDGPPEQSTRSVGLFVYDAVRHPPLGRGLVAML